MDMILPLVLCVLLSCCIFTKPTSRCPDKNLLKCAEEFNERTLHDIKHLERHSRAADKMTQLTTTESPTSTTAKATQKRVTIGCDANCKKRVNLAILLCRRRKVCKGKRKIKMEYINLSNLLLSSLKKK